MQSSQDGGFIGGYQVGTGKENKRRTLRISIPPYDHREDEERTCGQTVCSLFHYVLEALCKVRKTNVSGGLSTRYREFAELSVEPVGEFGPHHI